MTNTPLSIDNVDTFTGIGNGTIQRTAHCVKSFAIQVTGTGTSATAWNIVIEGSLNGTNFSIILTHTDTTGNGAVLYSGANLYPSLFFRSRVVSLTLGSATDIKVYIIGVS